MGTKVRRVILMAVVWSGCAAAVQAAAGPVEPAGVAAQEGYTAPAISGGHDGKSAWMVATYRQLTVRKITDDSTHTITIEILAHGDTVTIQVTPGSVSVTRAARTLVIDSAAALEALQQHIGTSAAVFAVRGLLSEVEAQSDLQASELSLLSAAAFVASLVGDIDAPRRLADRFVAKYRGIYRQARLPIGSCYTSYTTETTAAWNDLQACMADADEKDFFRAAYERLACNGVWLIRTESAWFEYLNCLSPLSSFSK